MKRPYEHISTPDDSTELKNARADDTLALNKDNKISNNTSSPLQNLPPELINFVAYFLDVTETVNWSKTCRFFKNTLTESLAKKLEELKVEEMLCESCDPIRGNPNQKALIYFLLRRKNGEVFSFGANYYGQLGLGDETTHTQPQQITFPNLATQDAKIQQMVACKNITLFLFDNGNVFGCGDNRKGQLGLGSKINKCNRPTQITLGQEIQKVFTDGTATFFLTRDGKVRACGHNICGRLGIASQQSRYTRPIPVQLNEKITEIYILDSATIFVTHDSKLYFTGFRAEGDNVQTPILLSLPFTPDRFTHNKGSLFFYNNKVAFALGNNPHGLLGINNNGTYIYEPTKINFPNIEDDEDFEIVSVQSKHNTTMITVNTKEGRKVFACGSNNSGQLGIGINETEIGAPTQVQLPQDNLSEIVITLTNSFFLFDNNRTLFGCGFNENKQLGLCDTRNKFLLTKIPIPEGQIKAIITHNLNYIIDNHILLYENGDAYLFINDANPIFKIPLPAPVTKICRIYNNFLVQLSTEQIVISTYLKVANEYTFYSTEDKDTLFFTPLNINKPFDEVCSLETYKGEPDTIENSTAPQLNQ